MTRRIMISTALIETPKLVIADEPTPGLDRRLAVCAMEHFRQEETLQHSYTKAL